MPPAGCAARGR